MYRLFFTAALALLPAACVHPDLAGATESKAILIAADAASHMELIQTVRTALHNSTVVLADDALLHDSTLVIERARSKDVKGLLLNGRETRLPERFQLLIKDDHCLLLHERTQQRWPLKHATCVKAT